MTEIITDFNDFKKQKKVERKENFQHRKHVAFDNINRSVATTISILSNELGNEEAYRVVMGHLSELVVAYDMKGGLYDE